MPARTGRAAGGHQVGRASPVGKDRVRLLACDRREDEALGQLGDRLPPPGQARSASLECCSCVACWVNSESHVSIDTTMSSTGIADVRTLTDVRFGHESG